MKKLLIITLAFTLLPLSGLGNTHDDSLSALLSCVESNNPQLKALRKSNEASIAEMQSENTIGETAVEYTPFFRGGYDGISSSELIVSQEFDFPTLYSGRKKAINLEASVLEKEYLILRRDILLEAECLCYDLIATQQNEQLLSERLAKADTLLALCNKRMTSGYGTVLELNRVKLDRMNIVTEAAKNRSEGKRIKMELEKLGANSEIIDAITPSDINISEYNGSFSTLEIEREQEVLLAAGQQVKLSNQNWLPKLTVGYRRNTETGTADNGVLFGVAMPLFTNSHKKKAVRLRQQLAEQELENTRTEVEMRHKSLVNEAHNIKEVLSTYDEALMQQTLSDLMKAVLGGELPIMDYYTESDRIHSLLQERLTTQNTLYKLIAKTRTPQP